MTVVVGTTINYFLDGRINRDDVLFPGVACFLIAVFLGAAVHSSNAKDDEQKLSMSGRMQASSSAVTLPTKQNCCLILKNRRMRGRQFQRFQQAKTWDCRIHHPGRGETIDQGIWLPQARRSLLLPLLLGNQPGNQQPVARPEEGRPAPGALHRLLLLLSVVFHARILRQCLVLVSPNGRCANFSVSCFMLGFCVNVWFLYHPMAGVPASTVGAYARDWNGRHWALLAGLLCGFGNGFQFMGGQAAGYAGADAVQALPLVSTFWGVILFVKYRRSSKKTYLRLAAMLLMFIIAVAVLMASAGHRKAIDANANETAQHLHIQHPLLNIPRI
ncbi:unnamed protein product [Urochloa humidicola]